MKTISTKNFNQETRAKFKVRLAVLFAAGVLGVGIAGAAAALPLNAGTTLTNPGYALAVPNYTSAGLPAGYSLVETKSSPYVQAIGTIFGSITSNVYRLGGTGPLAFEYQWFTTPNPTGGPTADLVRSTIGDIGNPWAGFAITNAGADNTGLSTNTGGIGGWTDGDPNFLLRDPSPGEGLTIQWRAQNVGTVLRGSVSDYSSKIWFITDATDYRMTDVGLLDGGAVSSAQAFAPARVPEPASLALVGLGLALAGFARRRVKKT